MDTMNKYKIINAEVYDHNQTDGHYDPVEDKKYWLASSVEVHIEIEINQKNYFLNYQTSNTHDIGAISSDLQVNDQSGDDSDDLIELFGEDEAPELFETIKKEARVQKIWDEYISENFIRNTNHFRGMDANSEFNEMQRITDV